MREALFPFTTLFPHITTLFPPFTTLFPHITTTLFPYITTLFPQPPNTVCAWTILPCTVFVAVS